MKNQQITDNNKKSAVFTLIGITIMILLTLTKIVPSSTMAGYSIFVGIVFFFITEAAGKTRGAESGLRFNTIAAFGEEIAYRGFFLGKGSKIFPIWVCAILSSAVFAAGHIAAGNMGIVAYDITTVFIDSLIFSVIYQKSGNCVISTFSHILGNAISLVVMFAFF